MINSTSYLSTQMGKGKWNKSFGYRSCCSLWYTPSELKKRLLPPPKMLVCSVRNKYSKFTLCSISFILPALVKSVTSFRCWQRFILPHFLSLWEPQRSAPIWHFSPLALSFKQRFLPEGKNAESFFHLNTLLLLLLHIRKWGVALRLQLYCLGQHTRGSN